MHKAITTIEEIFSSIEDNSTIAIGGFGLSGMPKSCLKALSETSIKHLTLISNHIGTKDCLLRDFIENKQIDRIITSYVANENDFHSLLLKSNIQLEIISQRSLLERMHAASTGHPTTYTALGIGEEVEMGSIVKEEQGRRYLLERAMGADVAIIKAAKGDLAGNLLFDQKAHHFNALCASASQYTIAEVDELLPIGAIEPDDVHLSGLFVDKIIDSKATLKDSILQVA